MNDVYNNSSTEMKLLINVICGICSDVHSYKYRSEQPLLTDVHARNIDEIRIVYRM